MSDFGNRIGRFVKHLGISVRSFEREIECSNGLVGNVLNKGTFLGADKLEKIFARYPELEPEWLLTGKGNMIKEAVSIKNEVNEPILNYGKACDKCKLLETQLIECQKDKEELRKDKEFLRDELNKVTAALNNLTSESSGEQKERAAS